jgi:hypothetical protein
LWAITSGSASINGFERLLDVGQRQVVHREVAVEGVGDSRHRHVVGRPAEAAGDEDGVVGLIVGPYSFGDLRTLVGHDQHAPDRHSSLGEPGGQPRGVRIHRVPREQLVSNRDQCDLHA